jgi:malic enzyme
MQSKTTLGSSDVQKVAFSILTIKKEYITIWHNGATPKISTTSSSLVSHPRNYSTTPALIMGIDGEEILGIGDQGCGGILISVAKLALTTLCGGLHPNRLFPVVLDCGTDNEDLLNDDLYLGLRNKRIRGEEYNKFVETFVSAARQLYPRAYIHFEDFGLHNGMFSSSLTSLPSVSPLTLPQPDVF